MGLPGPPSCGLRRPVDGTATVSLLPATMKRCRAGLLWPGTAPLPGARLDLSGVVQLGSTTAS